MNLILFDDEKVGHLFPLTFTRPASELRVGILTVTEKWNRILGCDISFLTRDYLADKYPITYSNDNFYVNGRLLPNEKSISAIRELEEGQSLSINDEIVAFRSSKSLNSINQFAESNSEEIEGILLARPHDLFALNGQEIESDFDRITDGRESQSLSESNTVIGNGRIFLEQGAVVEGAILNATNGSIYIGENAEIMEGSLVRGALALCNHSTLKLGAKIYGATTVGPHSKVGGEVNNSVILGYSNKGHDGFLGNSVIGEWCNIGADSNNSNLKNNYAEVKLWDYELGRFAKTGVQFCGLIMGDHSKCGINTMFNTGTVIGVSSNLFGSGFPRNFVPSFAWGGNAGFSTYQIKKAMDTASLVMSRRGIELGDVDREIMNYIFKTTGSYRFWEENKEYSI